MNKMKELEWTGERLVTSVHNLHGVIEHLHRYAYAQTIVKDKVVLDIASGEGYGSFLLSQKAKKVFGVDIDSKSIKHSIEKYGKQNNLIFKIGNGESIPLKDKTIDVVISFETIEHICGQDNFIKEVRRVLKDDGVLLISSPEKSIYSSRDSNNPYHVKELSKMEFNSILLKYFLNVVPLVQRYFIGSLLHLENNKDNVGFELYSGNYENIKAELTEHSFYNKPFFNISIASNAEISKSILKNSVFSGFDPITDEISFLKTQNSILNKSRFVRMYFLLRNRIRKLLN